MILRRTISSAIKSHFLLNDLLKCQRTIRQFATTAGITFQDENVQKYLEVLRREFYNLRFNPSGLADGQNQFYERMDLMDNIVQNLERHRTLQQNITSKEDIENEKDEDMKKLLQEEAEVYTNLLKKIENEIMDGVLNLNENNTYPSLIFEITAGAGGQEAMLFAKELLDMYVNFFNQNNWNYEILTQDLTDIGGLRHANIIVNDSAAFNFLRYEAGVHRVQRIPSTEKSGRVHTSTASVAVIPRPSNININISGKDLKIETKRASGAGGQHVNTTDSAVRIVHLPTGIAVECQTERSQFKNREIALRRLNAKLLQQQLESDEASKQATRKAQKGTLNRNEKIRTYNYVQDRITDHRIPNGTMHNLEVFLEGGEQLVRLMKRLKEFHQKVQLTQRIAESLARIKKEADNKKSENVDDLKS